MLLRSSRLVSRPDTNRTPTSAQTHAGSCGVRKLGDQRVARLAVVPQASVAQTQQPATATRGTRQVSLLHLGGHGKQDIVAAAPLLVYIPGADGTGAALDPQLKELTAYGYDIRALHIPQQDRSSWEELTNSTIACIAAAVATQAQRLEACGAECSATPSPRVLLLAESFGACLALRVAANSPHLIDKMVLINPGTSFARSYAGLPSLLAATNVLSFVPQPVYEVAQAVLVPLLVDRHKVSESSLTSLLDMMTMHHDTQQLDNSKAPFLAPSYSTGAAGEQVEASGSPAVVSTLVSEETAVLQSKPVLPWRHLPAEAAAWRLQLLRTGDVPDSLLKDINLPTLIIAAAQDRMLPTLSEAARLQRHLPSSARHVLPCSSHTPLLEEDVCLTELLTNIGFHHSALASQPQQPLDLARTELLMRASAAYGVETESSVSPPDAVMNQSDHSSGCTAAGETAGEGLVSTAESDEQAVQEQSGDDVVEQRSEEVQINVVCSEDGQESDDGSSSEADGEDAIAAGDGQAAGPAASGEAGGKAAASSRMARETMVQMLLTALENDMLEASCPSDGSEEAIVSCSVDSGPDEEVDTAELPVSMDHMKAWADEATRTAFLRSRSTTTATPQTEAGPTTPTSGSAVHSDDIGIRAGTVVGGVAFPAESPAMSGVAPVSEASQSNGAVVTQAALRGGAVGSRSAVEAGQGAGQLQSTVNVVQSQAARVHVDTSGLRDGAGMRGGVDGHRQQGAFSHWDAEYDRAVQLLEPWRALVSPVVSGTEHLPVQLAGRRPILFVGNHTQFGLYDMTLLLLELYLRGFKARGLAHPLHFRLPTGDFFSRFGAVKASPRAMAKLLANKDQLLLFPGGSREVVKNRDQKYQLLWREDVDFVRLAARFQAVIVPFASVGGDDAYELALEGRDILSLPVLGPLVRTAVRLVDPETPAEEVIPPVSYLPGTKIPSVLPLPNLERLYFRFLPAIDTAVALPNVKDAAAAAELYSRIKTDIRGGIAELLQEREQDGERQVGPRLMSQVQQWMPALDLFDRK